MSAPFKFFGSKHRIVKHYPAPAHPLIVEPFAGGASYALAYPDREVLLCETDPEVCALWRGLIAARAADVLALPIDLPEGLDIRTLKVPLWAQLLIRHNQRAGRQTCWTVSSWGCKASSHKSPSSYWGLRKRAQVAEWTDRIRHWQIFEGSITDAPMSGAATWFVDPPYQLNKDGLSVYRCAAPDFAALGAWCRSLEGQVIVCEAPGRDGRMPDWLPFRPLCDARVGPKAKSVPRTELVWTR